LNSIATKFFDTNSTRDIVKQLNFARGIDLVENLKINRLITSFDMTTQKFKYSGHIAKMYKFALSPELELRECAAWVALGTGATSTKGYFDQMNIRCRIKNFPDYAYMHIMKTNATEKHLMRFEHSEYTWNKITKEVF